MEIVKIQDLEVGDEIIISCQSYFKYLKVLRKPSFSGKTHWNTGKPLYNSVKVSTRREEEKIISTWRGMSHSFIKKQWMVTPDDHNFTQHIDLQDRQLLLVKKN